MEEEGAEYKYRWRWSSFLQRILSTSVQTVMLLARMLDTSRDVPSHKAYGEKCFAFTDKLDVIIRGTISAWMAEVHKKLESFRMQWRPDRDECTPKEVPDRTKLEGQWKL